MKSLQLALGTPGEPLKRPDDLVLEKPLGLPVAKGLDHKSNCTEYRYSVKSSVFSSDNLALVDPCCRMVT